ncbi:MAG: protein-tyrosine phosphatase family protein [Nocardioidaceae bacterium]
MGPELFTVAVPGAGLLSTMAHPPGGVGLGDRLEALRAAGADVVVSLLTPEEEAELGLLEEQGLATAAGLRLLRLPAPDMSVPEQRAATVLVGELARRLGAGEHVVVHCRAGIGRSSVLAALVLCARGSTPKEAVARISAARGFRVPETPEQRAFVAAVAAAL